MRKETSIELLISRCGVALLLAASLAGCSLPPSIPVLGAYFPGWLFCLVGALVLTVMVRALLMRLNLERLVGSPVVLYSALYALFSLLLWVSFF